MPHSRLTLLLSATALSLISYSAHALPRPGAAGMQPSIEVNLDAIRELRANRQGTQTVQPEAPIGVVPSPKMVWQPGLPGQSLPQSAPQPAPQPVPPAAMAAPMQPAPMPTPQMPSEIKAPPQEAPFASAHHDARTSTSHKLTKKEALAEKKKKAKEAAAAKKQQRLEKKHGKRAAPSEPVPLILKPPMEKPAAKPAPAILSAPKPEIAPPPPLAPEPQVNLPITSPMAPPPEAPPAPKQAEPQLLGHISEENAPASQVDIAPAVPMTPPPPPPEPEPKKDGWLGGVKKWFGGDKPQTAAEPKPEQAAEPMPAPTVPEPKMAEAPPPPPAPVEPPKPVELTPPPALKMAEPPPTPKAAPVPVAEAPSAPPAPDEMQNKVSDQQLASVPPAKTIAPAAKASGEPDMRILFASPVDNAIPPESRATLDKLAERLKADDNLRVSVVAHASSSGDQAITTRRVSLSRALAIRGYLMDRGVDNIRINVQAEGNRNPGDKPDRVDVFVLSPVKG